MPNAVLVERSKFANAGHQFIGPGELILPGNSPHAGVTLFINLTASPITRLNIKQVLHDGKVLDVGQDPERETMNRRASMKVRESLLHLPVFTMGIGVVGGSGSGKDTLVEAAREAELEGVSFPVRYTTRARRLSDTEKDGIFLADMVDSTTGEKVKNPFALFDELARQGVIGMQFTADRGVITGGEHEGKPLIEKYGWAYPDPGTVGLYSLGSSAINFAHTVPEGMLENMLIISVWAPDHTRGRRILGRSPDIEPTSLAYRLQQDSSRRMLRPDHSLGAHVDIVMNNGRENPEMVKRDFVEMVRMAVDAQKHAQALHNADIGSRRKVN